MTITSLSQLPKNRYHREYFPIEIVAMNEPVKVNSVQNSEMKELTLFKYTIADPHGNRGELVSWGEHIGYKTGDRINLRNFLVKEFRGTIQIVKINKTEMRMIV